MKRSADAGFTLIELLIVITIIGIIAAIAIPGLLRARMSANEATAIGSLRAINSSQQVYSSSCGNGFFASSLLILADPAPTGVGFISPDLGSGVAVDKSGYHLEMTEGSEAVPAIRDGCNPSGTAANLFSSYYASIQPLSPGLTGNRWFFTNSLSTIYQSQEDDFDGETSGNAQPAAGEVLQ